MRQCHSDYPEFIPLRKTHQDHRFKYMVHGIDENLRDVSQVGILGCQLYPGRGKAFMKTYEDTLGSKEGYLIMDTSPHGDGRYSLRSRVFQE